MWWGLYLNPPQQAMVLCVDEKSQIQALDRTQPGLPLKKGRCGTMTHDYKRNGTTTLFAALEILQGRVVGSATSGIGTRSSCGFSTAGSSSFPGKLRLHLVMDNYGTHKHPTRPDLAETASALCSPLCADQFQLAESGGAVVRRTHSARESGAVRLEAWPN